MPNVKLYTTQGYKTYLLNLMLLSLKTIAYYYFDHATNKSGNLFHNKDSEVLGHYRTSVNLKHISITSK